ncbi:5-carboxymethyl-2-hydroxymuconate Delta-isomerase [Lysobacter arvi]|uniref:5-carboxymethyl-2-hydroxymuconate Delta-isomerase n=1 Tax=Lysobacter arvi TaxID=3038776 RepID=A0ABU1C909_9GAMM|nr:5-carboxymethyl-2-hydroxymuconate Delta-isomerase [Lysobacter arvi]MDR0181605.1 5-carboxymethyl-2-hydroxymuconate Delta-isomerase [Lysobacter arvi]
MPHVTLQYTVNLAEFDPAMALRAINQALADSGHFDEHAIKSRALRLDDYRIGVADAGRAFIHVQLKVLPGRDDATRKALTERILDALATVVAACPPSTQLCVEVDELDARTYTKRVIDTPPA